MIKSNRVYRIIQGKDDDLPMLNWKDDDDGLPTLAPSKKKDDFPLLYNRSKTGSIPAISGRPSFSEVQSKEKNDVKETREAIQKAFENMPRQLKENFSDKDIEIEAERSVQEDLDKAQGTDDPLGKVLFSKAYTGLGAAQVNAKRNKIVNNAFQSADNAYQYLQKDIMGRPVSQVPTEELRQLAGNNFTKQIAVDRLDKSRKVEKAFNNGSRSLEDAALHFAAENGDESLKMLMDSYTPIKGAIRGEKVLQFIMNPDVQQLAEKNPRLKQELGETIYNFPNHHPESATKLLAQAIADRREKNGLNNSFANIVGKESTDKIMDELIADGTIPANYKNVYAKHIRPKLGTGQSIGRGIGNLIPVVNKAVNEAPIPTPGLLENVSVGLENIETSFAKSVAGLTGVDKRSDEQKTYAALEKELSTPYFEPEGSLHKMSMHGGQMIPFAASVFLGAGGLKAAGLITSPEKAQAAMMILATHGDNVDRSLINFPKDKLSQAVYVGTMDLLNGWMGKYLPGKHIPKLLSKAEPEIASVLKAMVDGKITTDAAKNKIINLAGNTISGAVKGGVSGGEFMGAIATIDDLLSQTLQGKGIDFSQSLEKGWDAFKTGFLATAPLGGFEGALKSNKGLRSQIISMAANPEHYKEILIQEAETNPELAKVKDDITQNLDYIGNVYKETRLQGKEKEKYVLDSLAEKVKLGKAEAATDPTLKKQYQQEAKNLNEIKEGALKGIPEEKIIHNQAVKEVKELYDNEFLSKGASEMLESKEGKESKPKFDDKKVKGFLEFIAQQSNNITEDGKFNTESDARKSAERQYPSQLIEIANEMFPEYRKTAEEADLAKEQPEEKPIVTPEGIATPIQENNVNLPTDETRLQNIPTEENKGAGDSTQAAIEESPEKERKLSDRYSKIVDENDLSSPQDAALKYFADGGKINPSELQRIFGGKSDKAARIGLIKNDAGTVKDIAHYLWENDPTGKYSDTDYINAIEDALSSHVSKSSMQKYLVETYDWEAAQEKYNGQAYGKEAIGIVERLSEEDINEILRMDSEKADTELETFINEKYNPTETIKPDEPVKPEAQEPPITEPNKDQPAAEEGAGGEKPPISEPIIGDGEGKIGGITQAANEVRRQETGLPEFQRNPQSFEQWNNEAEKLLKEGYDAEGLMKRLDADPTATATPVENAIRKIYYATVDAEVAKNPTDALLSLQKRNAIIGDKVNAQAGRDLVSLKGQGSPLSSISNFYVAKMEAAGVDKLTEQQKKETKEAFDNVQKADENATAAMEAYREEIAKLKAENELLKQKKTSTKKGDWAQQRKDAVEGAREALRKIRTGESGIAGVPIPYIRELIAIAPHVKKYVGGLLGEGAYNLKEVVTKAYEEFKGMIEGLTEKDIHNIIAGEFNEKKPTRNELAAKMRDLRDEAYYINKLERLLAGTEPKNEKKRVKRNREITELQNKIKEFQKAERDAAKEPKEEVDIDLKKLESIKKRNEKEAAEIKERIAKGDFETKKKIPFLEDPEMQKKFPQQYNATIDAIKKKEDARHEFDIALLRDEMSRRNFGQKATDALSKTAGTIKAITTGIDDSAFAIQTYMSILRRPRTGLTAFYQHIRQGVSQKKFDRWLTALHSSSDFKEMKDMGLDVTEPTSLKEREKEEIFNNRFSGTIKIKGKEYKLLDAPLKPFERAFTTLGNVTRVVGYRTISAKYKREGYTPEKNPKLFQSLARRLNEQTGRGKVNEYVEMANKVVTLGIWSPRLMAMKFNILGISDLASLVLSKAGTKGYYRQLHPKERLAAIRDVAQFATTVMALSYGFALANGGDIDTDPLSPTFMDVKLPNGKSYNFTGGFSGYIRSITQFVAGRKHINGNTIKVNPINTGLQFFKGKRPPVTAAILNSISGKDYMGQPTTPLNEVVNLAPISLRGIAQQIDNDGATSFFTQGIPTFFGFNVKNEKDYEKPESKPSSQRQSNPNKRPKRTD